MVAATTTTGRASGNLTTSAALGEGASAAAGFALQDGGVGPGCALRGLALDMVSCSHQAKGAGGPEMAISRRMACVDGAADVAFYESSWLYSVHELLWGFKVAMVGLGLEGTGRWGQH